MTTPSSETRTLGAQTLRMVAILVGACVLFVGTLSVAAVAITSKAMGGGQDGRAAQQPISAGKTPPQSI